MSTYDVNQPKPGVHSLKINSSNSTSNCSLDQMHNTQDQSFITRQENQNAAVYSVEEGIANILGRSQYNIAQENGQRRYGPPADWSGEHPQRGCEVFIGKIPRDCFEDELIPIFERIGPIFMFRLMMEFNGTNRGYGFCVYTNRDDTIRAVEELNNYEIRRGKTIGVCLSVDNCRLFVGGIPKNKSREEIFAEMNKVTDGVQDVISYPSVADKTKNRGFAFVEYESHKAAAMARRKLIPGRIQLWGQQIAVDWAEPEREVNEDVMSKVKILYIRNLMLTTSEEKLRDCFVAASQGDSQCIERVKKISDYAFIHFKDRDVAQRCIEALNGTKIDGSTVEVSWAKPADKGETPRSQLSRTNNQLINFSVNSELQNQVGHLMDPSSAMLAGSTAGASLYFPAIVAGGLDQFIFPNSGTGNLRNGSLRTGRRNAAGGRSAAAQREKRHPLEKLQQHQSNPLYYWEVLETLCQRNGWEMPVYRAIPFEVQDFVNGGTTHIFMGQVTIPSLAMQYQTIRCYNTTEEAKEGAAGTAIYYLQQIPLQITLSDMNRTTATPVIHGTNVQNLQPMGSILQMLIPQSLQSQNQLYPPISGSVSYETGLYGSTNGSINAGMPSMLPVNQNGSDVSLNAMQNLQLQNQLFNCQPRMLANQIANPTIMSYAGMIPAGAYILDANALNQSIGITANSIGSQQLFHNKNNGTASLNAGSSRPMQIDYATNSESITGINTLMHLDASCPSNQLDTYMPVLPKMSDVTAGQIPSSGSFQNQTTINMLPGKSINCHSLGLESTITPPT